MTFRLSSSPVASGKGQPISSGQNIPLLSLSVTADLAEKLFPCGPRVLLCGLSGSGKGQASAHSQGTGPLGGVLKTLCLLLIIWSCLMPPLEEKGFRWGLEWVTMASWLLD